MLNYCIPKEKVAEFKKKLTEQGVGVFLSKDFSEMQKDFEEFLNPEQAIEATKSLLLKVETKNEQKIEDKLKEIVGEKEAKKIKKEAKNSPTRVAIIAKEKRALIELYSSNIEKLKQDDFDVFDIEKQEKKALKDTDYLKLQELKKQFNNLLIEKGIKEVDSEVLQQAISSRVLKIREKLRDDYVGKENNISELFKLVNSDKDVIELQRQLKEKRDDIRIENKINELQTKIQNIQNGVKKQVAQNIEKETNPIIKELQKQMRELNKKTDDEILTERLNKLTDELNGALKGQEKETKTTRKVEDTPEIKRIKKDIKWVRYALNPLGSQTEAQLENTLAGDKSFSDTDIEVLQDIYTKVKTTRDAIEQDPTPENMEKYGLAGLELLDYVDGKLGKEKKNILADLYNLSRVTLTTWDIGAVLSQGGNYAFTKPWRRAFANMKTYAFNKQNYRKLQARIMGDPDFDLILKAGIRLNAIRGGDPTHGERIYYDNIFERINIKYLNTALLPIEVSQRLYDGFLSELRFYKMKEYLEILRNENLTPAMFDMKLREGAIIINSMTGSGSFEGFLKNGANIDKSVVQNAVTGFIFFSFRKTLASFQNNARLISILKDLVSGKPISEIKREAVYRQLGKYAFTYALGQLLALAFGDDDDKERKKSVFSVGSSLKLFLPEVENLIIDTTGGDIQVLELIYRLSLGERYNFSKGRLQDEAMYDTITKFAGNKLHPTLRALISIAQVPNSERSVDNFAKDFTGYNDVSVWEFGINTFAPISSQDIIKNITGLSDDREADELILGLATALSSVGINSSYYDNLK